MITKIIVEVISTPTPTPKSKPIVPIAVLTTNFGSGGQNNDVTYISASERIALELVKQLQLAKNLTK